MLELIEIQDTAIQGMTRPILCKGSDEKFYYAKGKGATASGLIKEWMAANLARELKLPIPNFEIAYIEISLMENYGFEAIRSLGFEDIFVSERIEFATDFKYTMLDQIKSELQQTIFLFDLWIGNEDRTLTEHSGNPNLIWESQMYIIDHNLAFDVNFDVASFKKTHVFHKTLSLMKQLDLYKKQEFESKLQSSLKNWSQWWNAIPTEWKEKNEDFYPDTTLQRLTKEAEGGIWLKL